MGLLRLREDTRSNSDARLPRGMAGKFRRPKVFSPMPKTRKRKVIMKDQVLLVLAERWIRDATEPATQDGSPEAQVRNAVEQGQREAKRECADTLRVLVKMLRNPAESI